MREQLVRVRRPGPLVVSALAYLVLASGVMIWRGISVSPDYLFLLLVPVALLSGHFFRFVADWVPFLALFLGYEAMRGIAPKTGIAPHVSDLVSLERLVFLGHVPSAVLQSWIPDHGFGYALAVAATVVYFCHFVFPIAVGMVLWLVDRTQFLRYTTTLLGMSLVAFVIFLLVPTAPPWYAADHGALDGVSKFLVDTLPSAVSPYYQRLNPNPVAALPSLHAAFPFLGFLALRAVYPRGSWIALGWCVLVWFSVIYLGEHYGVDVIAGVALAALSWAVMQRVVVPRVGALQHQPAVPAPAGAAPGEAAVA